MRGFAPPGPPLVSVVIPVWNVEPWLTECLDSALGQTLGDGVEVIAVDDGSTDGSGRLLDARATRDPRLRVVHQPNSGGPGGPRNTGLDLATGRFVFFLDGDDYLDPDALRRMVAMAERYGSDIVLGKPVGVDGRPVYRDTGLYRRNVGRADLALVFGSASALKLFRRSMIDAAHLRFPEGAAGGEDGDFMTAAYLAARAVSVLAEHDCYFVRRRPGSQTTRTDRRDDLAAYIERIEANRIRPVAAAMGPGRRREALLRRPIRKIAALLGPVWAARPPGERRAAFEVAAGVLRRWSTPRLEAASPSWAALRLHCVRHGLLAELEAIAAVRPADAYGHPLVERGRVYARYPHFRDATGIPDRRFDITRELVPEQRLVEASLRAGRLELAGEAYLRLVGGTLEVELRRWPLGARHRVTPVVVPTPALRDKVAAYPRAGYRAVIDLATIGGGARVPAGDWSIHLVIGLDGFRREVPLRASRGARVDGGSGGPGGARLLVMRDRELWLRTGRPGLLRTALRRMGLPLGRAAGRVRRRVGRSAARA